MLPKLPIDIFEKIMYGKILDKHIVYTIKIVSFANKELRNKIKTKYKYIEFLRLFPKDDIKLSDLNNIHSLTIVNPKIIISDELLKHNINLEIRNCNTISEMWPFKNIKNLDLSGCDNITDVSELGNVEYLQLSNCRKIKDISSLENVEKLDLSHCTGIEDFSVLGKQKYLCLRGINFSKIDNLKNVEVLDLSYNYYLNDISCLKYVKELDCSYSYKITINNDMNNEKLKLNWTNLSDVSNLKYVKELSIKGTFVKNLNPLISTTILYINSCRNIDTPPINLELDKLKLDADIYMAYSEDWIKLNVKDLDICYNYYV